MKTVRMSSVFWLVLGLMSQVACKLPDVQPFVAATTQLRSAVATSGRTAVTELEALAKQAGPNQLAIQDCADQLDQDWDQRVALMGALVEYAKALQSIVEAGGDGKESAEDLGESLQELGVSAGLITAGGSAAAGVAVNLAASLWGQITTVMAADDLEQALGDAQPAIDAVAQKLSQDLNDLDEILQDAIQEQRDGEETLLEKEIGLRLDLEAERKQIAATVGPGSPLLACDADRLVALDEILATTERWHGPLQARLAALDQRLSVSRHLVSACRAGLEQWAASHALLLETIRRDELADVGELLEAAQDIRTQIRKVREL